MTSTFSHTAQIAAPRGAVWEALQQAGTWSNIGPIDEVWDAEHADDGTLLGYRWSARAAGRTWKGAATQIEAVAERRIRLDLESSEIVGAITVELFDGEIAVSMEATPRSVMATMFWSTVKGALERGLPTQVEEFAKSLV